MLSQRENDLLSHVGPGTPMGDYFRRYWLPVVLSSEVPEPDGPPVRVRVLGEQLLAFRDTEGRVGLVEESCPHRLASLFFGRNEECGIRCVYHGWKFDVDGNCVDMPNEPEEYGFKNKVSITAYPTREYGDVIWAYLGPVDKMPELPEFEWAKVPKSHRIIGKRLQSNNYLQAIEGGIDSSHSNFLHASVEMFRRSPEWLEKAKSAKNLRTKYHALDSAPHFAVKRSDFGLIVAARRNAENDQYYWRLTQFLLPSYTIIPYDAPSTINGHCWVPIDDDTCFAWTFTFRPEQPLSEAEIANCESGEGLHAAVDPKTFRPVRNASNDYLIDRQDQKNVTMTGITGIGDQDMAVQESMGTVVDRTRERLGTSDTAIIAMRRLLLQQVEELQQGKEPETAHDGKRYWVRSASIVLDKDVPFHEGAAEMMQPSK